MRAGVAAFLLLCAVAYGAQQVSSAKPTPSQSIHDIIEPIKAVSGALGAPPRPRSGTDRCSLAGTPPACGRGAADGGRSPAVQRHA